MNALPGRNYFLAAVVFYGLSAIYSVFLWRKGFRQADRVNYGLLLLAGLAFAPQRDAFDVTAFDRDRVLHAAKEYLSEAPITVTASHSPRSARSDGLSGGMLSMPSG